MSYYDHATMMAHKLGPWADDPGSSGFDDEPHHRKAGTPALRRIAVRILAMVGIQVAPGFTETPAPDPDTDGDEAGKT